MDGVPDVTQAPVSSDETFEYEYEASPAGTYVYHSHVGLQLDRGLYGTLIVEEESSHVEYDREYTLQLDDYLGEEPALDSIEARRWHGPRWRHAETDGAGQAEMATGWAPMAGQAEMATDAVTVADRTMEWDRVETEVETATEWGRVTEWVLTTA